MVQQRKPRLELVWIGKDERPKLEPRILLEDAALSYGRPGGLSDNRLIFGDNLLALKALEQEFAGRVKCCFIDPPYNTGSAYAHYDDGLEHSLWLSLMRDRLELIRRLLSDDGSLWITIDDNEAHYLKVMCDEIFGRKNFVANVVWQKRFAPNSTARYLSDSHDHILVYAKGEWSRNLLSRTEKTDSGYRNPDDDPRGPWASSDLSARNYYSQGTYSVVSPGGTEIPGPPTSRYWTISKDRFLELDADERIWWGATGRNQPRLKRFLKEVRAGVVPQTVWFHDEVGHNQEAKKESNALFGADNAFVTPKPERLIKRILEIATNPGDLVLDSFAGSGTTGAVAHKMGRRWIMVELGEHCHTHIVPRLRKVIDGEDKGGVTEAVGWKGGGGFRYFRLAPSLLEFDAHGREIVSPRYGAAMLAEAVCKIEGFIYAPSDGVYWQHGHSTERDFIYVVGRSLALPELMALDEEVGPERSLLVVCRAWRGNASAFANLTVKRIPKSILARCEWSRDDYSLNVAAPAAPPPARPSRRSVRAARDLFETGGIDAVADRSDQP